ncbi:Zinc knuckle [Popillia japonica]|uniref:Zinc knuckle n=1 Tax=Popillia japonica TaxID=7064 RepID=A0AAW1JDW2_POPJA
MKPENEASLNKFLICCRTQASNCSFGKSEEETREINIKDKLIDTWAPVYLKKKLLEKELPLNEVVDQCQIYEQTHNQSSAMQEKEKLLKAEQINRIEQSRKQTNWETMKPMNCSRCGGDHDISNVKNCPAINTQCHKCGRPGHFARRCRIIIKM